VVLRLASTSRYRQTAASLAEGQKKIIEDRGSSEPKLDQTMARPRTITLPDPALAQKDVGGQGIDWESAKYFATALR
jgi:hypothetical protein